ncbi:MAG: biotin--[acetyl-CoA-carboxylase] ligase [Ruminococcaceae bacterium]|nr:biotin--[acetyl-CoA-carboxylase] ligase [Oscillospiraceae bacterium]
MERKIYKFDAITSTNEFCKDNAKAGAPEGMIAVADMQTMGRGRMGRVFESPRGTGLYLSMVLRPKFGKEFIPYITTAAAVAAARTIEKVSPRKAFIKWVNDIYVDNKKAAGILAESSFSDTDENLNFVILGIGVNILPPKNGFSDNIKDIAGSIFKKIAPSDIKDKLTAAFLNEFEKIYEALPDISFIKEYRERSFLIGKEITFIKNEAEICATVLDVDEKGALVVKNTEGETVTLTTGEVNIKKDEKFFKAINE